MPCGQVAPGHQMLMFRDGWIDATPCLGCGAAAVGPEMGFGHELLRQGVSSKIGFIPTAVGGTNLAGGWMPPIGPQYSNMVNTTRAAMAAAPPGAVIRGLVWVQGESDGLDAHDAGYYWPNFQKFLHSMRDDFEQWSPIYPDQQELPIVMAIMSTTNRQKQYPFISYVREAQNFTAYNNASIASVDMENFEFYFQDMGWGPQWTHLSKNGECAMGTAMAQAWVSANFRPFKS